jgi:hypothetical protein
MRRQTLSSFCCSDLLANRRSKYHQEREFSDSDDEFAVRFQHSLYLPQYFILSAILCQSSYYLLASLSETLSWESLNDDGLVFTSFA